MLDQPTPPTWREGEVSAVLDAAPTPDRPDADVLLHPDPKRKLRAKFEVMARTIIRTTCPDRAAPGGATDSTRASAQVS